MRLSALPLIPLVATAALAAPGAAHAPRSAAARHEEIRGAVDRLEALLARARVPVSLDVVRLYRSYTPEQLAEPRSRTVDVEDILDIAKDPEETPLVRAEAAAAVVWDSALRNERKLDLQGKAMGRPRAKFTKKVLPMLTDRDLLTRELGKRIIEGLWPGVPDKDITSCNPADPDSCSAARRAWTRYLER